MRETARERERAPRVKRIVCAHLSHPLPPARVVKIRVYLYCVNILSRFVRRSEVRFP